MMRTLALSVVLATMIIFQSAAIAGNLPFDNLKGKSGEIGWGFNNKNIAQSFNEERKRLGDTFQDELLTFVGNDVKRHYWCAVFLSSEKYAGTQGTMEELALLIFEQGITICRGNHSEGNNKYHIVSLSVFAAILCQRLGLVVQAKYHRANVMSLKKEDPICVGGMPALTPENREIFNSIPIE